MLKASHTFSRFATALAYNCFNAKWCQQEGGGGNTSRTV